MPFRILPFLILFFTALVRAESLPDTVSGKRVLILGDSITQAGTWVGILETRLRQLYPEAEFDFISVGLASETVSGLTENDHPFPRPDLHERLDRGLEMAKPDLVIACYGMNDGIYHPPSADRMKAYQSGIKKLAEKCSEVGAPLIILAPPPFDPFSFGGKLLDSDAEDFSYKDAYRDYDSVLAGYGKWLLDTASKRPEILRVIDLHAPLSDFSKAQRLNSPEFTLSPDGIHPNFLGHFLIAVAISNALGDNWQPDAPIAAAEKIKEAPLFQLVEKRRKLRSKAWLEAIGFTRGETIRKNRLAEIKTEEAELLDQIHLSQ